MLFRSLGIARAARWFSVRQVKVVFILLACVSVIIGLTYMAAGAWLRDRQRSAELRRPREEKRD